MNKLLKSQHTEVAFKANNLIWDYMMAQHYKKHQVAELACTLFPTSIMLIVQEIEGKAMHMIAHSSYEGEMQVTNNDGWQYIVTLKP